MTELNYTALKNNLIVSLVEATKTTSSGIILQKSQEPNRAKVLSVGNTVDEVSVGDELLVDWNKAHKIDKSNYRININDVVAIFG